MNIQLPPKRWQLADSPRFDSIRWKPWFVRLLKRKHHIPLLHEAYKLVQQGQPQWKAAAEFTVDARELRDYCFYVSGVADPVDKVIQDIINDAYFHYCEDKAELSFHAYVEGSAKLFGVDPRVAREAWEVNPVLYPIGYK